MIGAQAHSPHLIGLSSGLPIPIGNCQKNIDVPVMGGKPVGWTAKTRWPWA
jgi:hypothetical protein